MTKSPSSLLLDKDRLKELTAALLKAGGYTAEEADMTAGSLVLANLKGHDSHGVIRVAEYIHALKKGRAVSGIGLEVLKETANSLWCDGGKGLGQVQMPRLLDKTLLKADNNGVVSAVMKHSGHIGRLGEWVEIIAASGYAGLVLANDNGAFRAVAPPGGKDRVTSTNPLAFGCPRKNDHDFIFDMSTSAAAMGRMRLKYLAGDRVPAGLIQDADGKPATDPGVLFDEPKGALRPAGGDQDYKGFGLSMIVDLLSAGLSGGSVPPAPAGTDVLNNVMVTVWNPAFFAGFAHFTAEAERYSRYIRQSAPTDPAQSVRLPGDRSSTCQEERAAGGIKLSVATAKVMAKSAQITGIDIEELEPYKPCDEV